MGSGILQFWHTCVKTCSSTQCAVVFITTGCANADFLWTIKSVLICPALTTPSHVSVLAESYPQSRTILQGQHTQFRVVAFLKFLTFSSGHDGQRHAQKLRIEDGQKVSLGCAACWEELWVGRAAIWSLQLTTDTGGPGSCSALGTRNREYTLASITGG